MPIPGLIFQRARKCRSAIRCMENNAMKVSAIISTYNSAKFLPGRLHNLLDQTIRDQMEIVIINSGSQENEQEIVESFRSLHEHIVYISTEREGLYAAWNRAIKLSRGQYLITANTDDRTREDAYEILSSHLDAHERIGLVYANLCVTNEINDILRWQRWNQKSSWKSVSWPEYKHMDLLLQCLCGPQPMWRRSVHNQVGYFDESFKIAGDYEFWLRVAERYDLLHIDQFLGLFYDNPGGISRSDSIQSREENLRARKKYFSSTTHKYPGSES